MAQTSFHFSPRPNRAHEIRWREWGQEAFDEASATDKPVLLGISAVWCHWCHVMDETTYSDPDVIAALNRDFIPVRVDNDRRPDVNARYNMGGWPTTAVLAPDGTILTGATYLPAASMQRLLAEIRAFYADNKALIAERAATLRARTPEDLPAGAAALSESTVTGVAAQIAANYDEEYGGFGVEPKFPQTDALELLLLEHRVTGDARSYEMVARTMLEMSRGGMYDRVEGGFFRYSTTRDWSVPHFEKMAEDHAGLVRTLASLCAGGNPEFRTTLVSATRYLMSVLYDAESGFFGGSQDADEAYFSLALEERRKTEAPYVDCTAYANWNAGLASALFAASLVLEDETLSRAATRVLDELHAEMRDGSGLLFHYRSPAAQPQAADLLTDQAAYLRALLDAHEATGEQRFLDRALDVRKALRALAAPGAGHYDRVPERGEIGNLAFRDRPMGDNALIADSLLRIGTLTEDESLREEAAAILKIYAQTYQKAGSFAAGYARAVRRYLTPPALVKITGAPAAAEAFREAARRLPHPFVALRTTEPQAQSAAYVCRGTACAAPVSDPAALATAFDRLPA